MTWVKLDDQFYSDPSFAQLESAESCLLFLVGLAYAGQQETDGVIPRAIVRRNLLGPAMATETNATELVMSGLWTVDDSDNYVIRSFLKWNRSRAEAEEQRSSARDRMAAVRKARKLFKPDECSPEHLANSDRTSPEPNQNFARSSAIVPTSTSTSTSNHSTSLKKKDDQFAEFWNHYPRNTGGPKKARAVWGRLSAAERALAVDAAEHYGLCVAAVVAQGVSKAAATEFAPHATTWLNAGRWGDDPEQVEAQVARSLPKSAQSLHADAVSGWGENVAWGHE